MHSLKFGTVTILGNGMPWRVDHASAGHEQGNTRLLGAKKLSKQQCGAWACMTYHILYLPYMQVSTLLWLHLQWKLVMSE